MGACTQGDSWPNSIVAIRRISGARIDDLYSLRVDQDIPHSSANDEECKICASAAARGKTTHALRGIASLGWRSHHWLCPIRTACDHADRLAAAGVQLLASALVAPKALALMLRQGRCSKCLGLIEARLTCRSSWGNRDNESDPLAALVCVCWHSSVASSVPPRFCPRPGASGQRRAKALLRPSPASPCVAPDTRCPSKGFTMKGGGRQMR